LRPILASALVCAFLACSAADTHYGSATGSRVRTSSGSSTNGASSTGTASRGSNSAATSGSSSGTSGPSDGGPLDCKYQALTDCSPGTIELLTQAVNAFTQEILTSSIQITDINNASFVASSDANGLMHLCVPPNTPLAPEFEGAG
jgi:hypothetical protein